MSGQKIESKEHALGCALFTVLVKVGVLDDKAQPTGPELIAAAQVFCESDVSRLEKALRDDVESGNMMDM